MTPDPAGLRLVPLARWLADHGLADGGPLTAHLLAGGRSNVSYRVIDSSGADLVVRRPPLGHVMPSAHDMSREHTVLAGLNSVDFPTPQVRGTCSDTSVIGAPFLVMDFVSGRVIENAADAAFLPSDARADMSDELVRTLARLHRIDPQQAGLDQLGRAHGYLQRQVRRWSEQWELSRTRDLPGIERLQAWLRQHVDSLPTELPGAIVHGDYRIDNVIWHPVDNRIVAVVDWEMATLGDPVSDLAIAMVYWSEPNDTLRARVPVAEHITDAPGFWSRSQLVTEYQALTGFDVSHLDFCVALACLKLAVIMESIHKRNLAGQQLGAASGADDRMAQATLALTELGLATIDEGVAALGG